MISPNRPGSGGTPTSTPAAASPWGVNAAAYRPLNVRDALSYLDQVKVSHPSDARMTSTSCEVLVCMVSEAWFMVRWDG